MLKGIRKNIFVVKCDRHSPFESAMFILKENAQGDSMNSDILAEAQRLVESAFLDQKSEQSTKKLKKNKKRQGL